MEQLFNDASAKKNPMGDDTKYSRAIKVPQYEPNNKKPDINELCDTEKYSKLMARINKSDVSEDEKKFLQLAATRHIVFTYSKIADYYAHASAEMQSLMEESALIILDIDDAIANGYVKLSEKMQQLVDEEKKRALEAKEPAIEEENTPTADLVDDDDVESVSVDWKSLRPAKDKNIKKEESGEDEK